VELLRTPGEVGAARMVEPVLAGGAK